MSCEFMDSPKQFITYSRSELIIPSFNNRRGSILQYSGIPGAFESRRPILLGLRHDHADGGCFVSFLRLRLGRGKSGFADGEGNAGSSESSSFLREMHAGWFFNNIEFRKEPQENRDTGLRGRQARELSASSTFPEISPTSNVSISK